MKDKGRFLGLGVLVLAAAATLSGCKTEINSGIVENKYPKDGAYWLDVDNCSDNPTCPKMIFPVDESLYKRINIGDRVPDIGAIESLSPAPIK